MYQDLVRHFVELLQLKQPPIGLAFLEHIPKDIPHIKQRVPSACTFWRLAEQGIFYANAEDHQECLIGMQTMGFPMSEAVRARSREFMQMMAEVQYISPAEMNMLPAITKPHQCIVYGRLDQFPGEAEVVLCILDTQQAMLIAEAQGNTNWLRLAGQSSFGRPTCAIIPRTVRVGETTMSFGCVGARSYIDLTPGEMVMSMPCREFSHLIERLEVIVAANNALASIHGGQRKKFQI